MLRVFRHLVACLLAMTLSAQLVEAQLLSCDQMQMTIGVAGEDTSVMAMHDVTRLVATGGTATQSGDDHSPASRACDLEANCLNASAVPSFQDPHRSSHGCDDDALARRASATSRPLRPELPPPRL